MTLPHGWRWLPGAVLGAWCLLAASAAARTAWRQPPDPLPRLDREFAAFLPLLPSRGEVGYLSPYREPGSVDALRTYYAAQYALVPLHLVDRPTPEYLIVASGADDPGGDPRLEGFVEVVIAPGGHRLFRRAR